MRAAVIGAAMTVMMSATAGAQTTPTLRDLQELASEGCDLILNIVQLAARDAAARTRVLEASENRVVLLRSTDHRGARLRVREEVICETVRDGDGMAVVMRSRLTPAR